nr:heterogeneous nuclear ribonucleoprotein A3 homolog 1-like [Rhipicephalus microplus]
MYKTASILIAKTYEHLGGEKIPLSMMKNLLSITILAAVVCLAVTAPAAKKDAPATADAGKEEKIEGRGGLFGGGPLGYAGGFPGHLGGAAYGQQAGGYQGGFAGGAQGFNQGSAGFAGGNSFRNVQGYNNQMGYSSSTGFSKTDSNRYGTGYGQHSGGFAGGAAGHQGSFGQSGFGQVGGIGHF